MFVAIRRVRKRADGSPSLEEKLRVENNDDDKRRNEGKCNRNRPIPVSLLSCAATSKTILYVLPIARTSVLIICNNKT